MVKSGNKAVSPSRLQMLWYRLVEPHPSVPHILPYERAKVLAVISLFLVIMSVPLILILDGGRVQSLIFSLIWGGTYGLSRTKRPFLGSIVLITSLLVFFYTLWFSYPEFILRSLIFLAIPILLSVLLLPAYATLLICIVSFMGVLGLIVLQYVSIAILGDVLVALFFIMLLAVALGFLREGNIRMLQAQQAQLDITNAMLEQRVRERTKKAKEAQREAEQTRVAIIAANQKLEEQVWVATQQNELAEAMRGDLRLDTLSQQVITCLCQTLGVPIGTLFVMIEGQLHRKGSYACLRASDQKPVFEIGEGLVGQVAQSKKNILLENVPDSYMAISLGVHAIKPNYVELVPFLHEDYVLGVIEFGYLETFSSKQRVFLNQALDMLGISFHTAYIREQMQQLLQANFGEVH